MEEIESRLESVISHDTASDLTGQMRSRLLIPSILAGVGVLNADARAARIEAENVNGDRIEVEARIWRYGESRER